MSGILAALGIGFLLGLRHATDADHVVAVTAIVSRERSLARAARIGALWGVGHSLTVLALGGSIVAFRLVIPPRVGLGLEFGVALMLILLGFLNLRRHSHASIGSADGSGDASVFGTAARSHSHPAGMVSEGTDSRIAGRFHGAAKPLAIGVVHGLAGSAAVAILVLTTIQDTVGALAYLGLFGLGTVAGMMLVTVLLAAPAFWAAHRAERLYGGIRLAAGALSLVFGVLLARELIVDGGLFSDAPQWDPH